jgi:galactose-1-phosphate uridylyltransferase
MSSIPLPLRMNKKITTIAGFEMGSGIYINISFPEETAQFLREG